MTPIGPLLTWSDGGLLDAVDEDTFPWSDVRDRNADLQTGEATEEEAGRARSGLAIESVNGLQIPPKRPR